MGAAGAGGRGAAPNRDAGGNNDAGRAGAGASTGGISGSAGASGSAAGSTGGASGTGGAPACVPTAEQRYMHDSIPPAPHIDAGLDPAAYNSRPPSSGLHCAEWGAYTTFTEQAPLPACNFVHNLEHGAIVFFYNCPLGCPEIVAGLKQVMADTPDDPNCSASFGIKRLVLTPYAEMEATVAAAAWGYTWTSSCPTLDSDARNSLLNFVGAHWGGDAPEPTMCNNGTVTP